MSWPDLAKGGRILVVDDVWENVRVLYGMLKDEHEVFFALDGEKALELAASQLPDIILLDAVMPGMDGYQVCAALHASPLTKDIPVIFITAQDDAEYEERALDAGAVDFIGKPVNAGIVRARLRVHLALTRQAAVLRRMSLTDGLTGLANRRCFDETLDREWRRCQRSLSPLGLIMIDIDHFKSFNDRYGHQAGDACLRAVAETLGQCVRRATDIVARYGGEEIVALLPEQPLQGTMAVAERMLEAVRARAIPHEDSVVAPIVTISLGVTSGIVRPECLPGILVNDADSWLYVAKNSGRNRIAAPTEEVALNCGVRCGECEPRARVTGLAAGKFEKGPPLNCASDGTPGSHAGTRLSGSLL